MKKVRFAYQIRITQFCIGVVQFFLVVLLGILLVSAPYVFSPNSPRFYTTRKTHKEFIQPKGLRYRKEADRVYYWKELNVSFVEDKKQYYGQIKYCSQYDSTRYETEVKEYVAACALSVTFNDPVIAYQVSSDELTPLINDLFLKSDIFGKYKFEILFAVILAVAYLVATFFFELSSVFYVEFRWRRYFTLVKNSQLPKSLKDINEDREPFLVKTANYDRFGRMTMKRGCLVCPKFKDNENVPNVYDLRNDAQNISHFRGIKPKSGYWKVLAASSRHQKEKILYVYQVPLKKIFFSIRGLVSIFSLPLAMVVIALVLVSLLVGFIIFQGPVLALSAICVIGSIICLYVIAAIFEFFGGIVQLYSEQVIITNSRIVFMWLERFNNKIEYLYYDDIDNLRLRPSLLHPLEDQNEVEEGEDVERRTTTRRGGSTLIRCDVNEELVKKLKEISPRDDHLSSSPLPFFEYISMLERGKVEQIMNQILDLKEKYKTFEESADEEEEERGRNHDDEDDDENNEELKEIQLREVEENQISLGILDGDDEEEEKKEEKNENLVFGEKSEEKEQNNKEKKSLLASQEN